MAAVVITNPIIRQEQLELEGRNRGVTMSENPILSHNSTGGSVNNLVIGEYGYHLCGGTGISAGDAINLAAARLIEFLKVINLLREDDDESSRRDLKMALLSSGVSMEVWQGLLIENSELFQSCATWLCREAKQLKEGEQGNKFLSHGAVNGYLTNIRSLLMKTFPKPSNSESRQIFSNGPDKAAVEKWYTNCRYDVVAKCNKRDIEMGVTTSQQKEPVGRARKRNMTGAHLKTNSTQAILNMAMQNTDFNSAGRPSEVAHFSWSLTYWCHTWKRTFTWQSEIKTREQKPMSWTNDYEFYEVDQSWTMAAYLIMGGSNIKPSTSVASKAFVFPHLHEKELHTKSAAAGVISTSIKDLMPTTANIARGMPLASLLPIENCSAGSLRIGAVKEMALTATMQATAMKTGHEFTSRDITTWTYLGYDEKLLNEGTNALAGWPHPKKNVHPATLVFMNRSNEKKIHNWCGALFNQGYAITQQHQLVHVAYHYLATWLMYLTEFSTDVSVGGKYAPENSNGVALVENILLTEFKRISIRYFQWETCLAFGDQVREQFRRDNALFIGDDEESFSVQQLIPFLQSIQQQSTQNNDNMAYLRSQVSELKLRERSLEKQCTTLVQQNAQILGMMQELLSRSDNHSRGSEINISDSIPITPLVVSSTVVANSASTVAAIAGNRTIAPTPIRGLQFLPRSDVYELSSTAITEMTIATLSILMFKHGVRSTRGLDGKFKDTFKISPECRQSMQRVRRGIAVIRDVLSTNAELESSLRLVQTEPDLTEGNIGAWMEQFGKAAKDVEKLVHDKLYELENDKNMTESVAPLKRKRPNQASGGKVLFLTTLISRLEKTSYAETFKQM